MKKLMGLALGFLLLFGWGEDVLVGERSLHEECLLYGGIG